MYIKKHSKAIFKFKKQEEVEWVCRECGYVHKNKEAPKSFLKTAIKTAVIFGIYHFSPTGGLLNIPIIIVNIALGLIHSKLNHKKNNLWASSACSIVNAFFLTANLKYLKFS